MIRAGVIDRGRTVNDPDLIDLALACARVFTFAGPEHSVSDCRQPADCVRDQPEILGGIPLTIAAGADFPAMLVDLTLGRPVAPILGEFRPDLWITSYEASLFMDASSVRLERCVHAEVGNP